MSSTVALAARSWRTACSNLDRLVLPHQPRLVVLYAGENDLSGGMPPEKVAADFDRFRERIHAALPGTRIIYISNKPSPSRRQHFAKFQQANALHRRRLRPGSALHLCGRLCAMLGADGQPRPDIFVGDNLHLNPAGYAVWTRILGRCCRNSLPRLPRRVLRAERLNIPLRPLPGRRPCAAA